MERWLVKNIEDFGEFFANLLQQRRRVMKQVALGAAGFLCCSVGLPRTSLARARIEIFPRTLDGVALLIEQALDLQHQLDIFATVQPMTLSGFLRAQGRELRFPKP